MVGAAAVRRLLISASLLLQLQCLSSSSSAVGCSERERDALLQFRAKLEDPSGVVSSWKGTRDCCKWRGVGCSTIDIDNSTHVRVSKLDLHNSNGGNDGFFDYSLGLTGEIDPALLMLKHLQHLDLSGNDFGESSSFPVFLSEFAELQYLNLSGTNLFGIVPPELGNLSRIQCLDFSFNTLLSLENGGGFLSRLSTLEYLDMTGVNMANASGWLESLNALPSISVVRMMQCQIEYLPYSLHHLNFSSLTILDLSRNYMIESRFPDWLFRLTSIQNLNFGSTVSGGDSSIPFPQRIANLHQLRFLDFSANLLTGYVPESFFYNLSFMEEISLSDNNLTGPIPNSIGRLSSLRELDLSNNQFTHSIPESIFKISCLSKLLLPNNNLTGSIPTTIGTTLKSLHHLNLGSNTLTGLIPTSIGNLTTLQEFDLSHNGFHGSIPDSLCNLTQMFIFDLSYNPGLNGTFPKCLFQNTNLQKLGIGGNGIHGIISSSDLENLTELDSFMIIASESLIINIPGNWIPPFNLSLFFLRSCKIGPKFPMWLQTQKSLVGLSLTYTQISGNLPTWIWNFSSLITIIDISSNNFSGNLPQLTSAPSIFDISAGFNKFQGSNWFSGLWEMMPNIQFLSLKSNHMNGSVPSSLCKSIYLQGLDLSLNSLSGTIPSCLMKINNYLNLQGNEFHGPFPSPKVNKYLCSLKSLHLGSNKLSGIVPHSFQSCHNIVVLDLGQNMFSGNIPPWIAESMHDLKILRLKSNMFSGEIPSSLSSLSSLQVIDLSHNNLSGAIPKSFGDLAAMTYKHKIVESMGDFYGENISVNTKGESTAYTTTLSLVTSIDLSSNGLVGEIPDELGKLVGLVFLKLATNHLTGRIPEAIGGGLKFLETLDLSQNHLSGHIPKIMTKMTLLNNLNLSFNNLSGSIPTGNQFGTFIDPSIFMGNPNLCGSPIKRCVDNEESPPLADNNEVGKSWIYLSALFGFILGFWVFYGTLFFKKTWRYSYFQYINQINDRMYVWYVRKML